MARFVLMSVLIFSMFFAANAANNVAYDNFQTVYTESPVQSYYAYPDDVNFVPETEFMGEDNGFDFDENILAAREERVMQQPGVIFGDRPMVICRNFGCTRLNDKITRTFLFNSLVNMFMVNAHSRMYICEADPFSRDCLQSGISFPVRSGIANAMVKIPKATISQVNTSTGLSKATISMTYDVLVNGIDKRCEPTVVDIVVPVNSQANLASREFSCNLTSDGYNNVSLLVSIDYIDLDYGILGGYYSIGLQGSAFGGSTGYALFKTEYTTRGTKYRGMTNDDGDLDGANNAAITIQPGEYAVEPLKK
ncbi:MAG: hypothetical protein IJ560_00400 [Alphaproteobacteria bacterium]|nr:hypothetical protein [Alphaproteobacteria bacterium]